MNGILVVWDQYLPENMKWSFGNLGSIKSLEGKYLENFVVNGFRAFVNLDNRKNDGGIFINL